ncbi:chaplin [Streptomyces sp. NPDC093085]|uniref:chaplin n=1 Tax=Streptomyces sp. NPDC093085 TaxID=3155068 RepID=UPI003444C4ED
MKFTKAAAAVAGLVLALGAASPALADAGAEGIAVGSPGVLSGNVVQVPVHLPVNICGNSVDIIALLNPTAGNVCVNG